MRQLTQFVSSETETQLNVLVDASSSVLAYQKAMTELGTHLASAIHKLAPLPSNGPICVVCTVEDADFLARGILDGLQGSGIDSNRLRLICFWNERVRSFNGSNESAFDVAPVIKEYREPTDVSNAVIVVVKSIISGACVVKTNLAMLIDRMTPKRVIVAAPVMLEGAEKRLAAEFPRAIADHFEYITFAVDDQKGPDDNVIPGIGGSVYERLGVTARMSHVPQIVKERRRMSLKEKNHG